MVNTLNILAIKATNTMNSREAKITPTVYNASLTIVTAINHSINVGINNRNIAATTRNIITKLSAKIVIPISRETSQ